IPLRLLVPNGSQQAPVLTALLSRLLEPFLVQRQAALQMEHEATVADELQVLGASIVALDDRGKFAIGIEPREIAVHVAQESRIAGAGSPRQRLTTRKIEGNAQFRMSIVRQREFRRIGDGVVNG